MAASFPLTPERTRLGMLLLAHIAVYCLSLLYLAHYRFPVDFDPTTFHVFWNPSRLGFALLATGSLVLFAPLFAITRFSFGYFVGFYLYTVALGFLWLNAFTDLKYDHRLAAVSAAASAVAFILPALFISKPVRQIYVLSEPAFDRLLTAILVIGAAVIAAGAFYDFRIVLIGDIYEFRATMTKPVVLSYLIGMTSGALLPFAFAGFVMRNAYWRAAAALLLLLSVYPVVFNKTALFAPFWLVFMLALSRLFEARVAVVLSLLLPLAVSLALIVLFGIAAASIFSLVNFRMVAVPSVAIGVYSDFFSSHDLTYFCQITPLKTIMSCPYHEQLSLVMEKAYKLGNFNASLLAEGIASVGLPFAPVAVLAAGLVVAIGNRLSAGLPATFVMLSGALVPQLLLNIPLSTVLLTHGAGLLFLLWYITPRTIFDRKPDEVS
ncbi:hypothetical protein JQ628_01435 [Bradyrhizobium lablabi]|uniref:hypothetical protein n=1 Tax=Bradyrhizobium lablabi TaxID=722472 RepID=UPI001BA605B0|nr:hypothetical protein [Bradyrhizobium lablabi]MBR1120158.1 hypothetical protein [Bradyrhizobium lablabi]